MREKTSFAAAAGAQQQQQQHQQEAGGRPALPVASQKQLTRTRRVRDGGPPPE
ncbi:hypothetical protein DIPPA_20631 [Diplonema papillatum]|nr:hypothetical protein DIPPA_20631 [Diplonema papillatum]